MGALRFLMVLTASLTLLCGLWAMARGGGVDLAGFALVFGAAHAGCITLYPAVAAIWFGKLNLGAILGALYVAVGIVAVAGASTVLSALAVPMAERAGVQRRKHDFATNA